MAARRPPARWASQGCVSQGHLGRHVAHERHDCLQAHAGVDEGGPVGLSSSRTCRSISDGWVGCSAVTRDELTTADSWDRLWGSERSRQAGVRSRLRQQTAWLNLLRRLLDTPTGSADVLELGCAPGAMIEQLHILRPDHRYRDIDIAADGLKIARRRLSVQGIDADLQLGDIRNAEVPPADLVMSFGLAEHFANPVDALRYHRRFVKPGGHVAVTVPNYAHPVVVWAMRWFSPDTLATHNLSIMSVPALHQAMTDAGFMDVQVGESGGPTLPASRPRPGPVGKAYRLAARAWNVGSTLLPEGLPWSTSLWAVGRAT